MTIAPTPDYLVTVHSFADQGARPGSLETVIFTFEVSSDAPEGLQSEIH